MTGFNFSDAEHRLVAAALQERYGHPVAIELVEAEIRLDPQAPGVTVCPALYWKERGVEFVILKICDGRYRSQFTYSLFEQFGPGRDFEDLAECVTTTLRLQADHEQNRAGVTSGKTGAEIKRNC